MSGLLLLCTELTLFWTEWPEKCIYLNQSEPSNFFMCIISFEIELFEKFIGNILRIAESLAFWLPWKWEEK